MKRCNVKLSQKGFTMVEVLVTIFLLAVGVVGVQKAYNVGLRAGADIENVEIAMNLAQSKMEELRKDAAQDFDSLADFGPTVSGDFTNFSVTVNVDDGADPMAIDVTVTWTSSGGPGAFVLSTIVSDYED